jgi:tetratricopeptide (TPR) repeat protein
MPTCPTCGRDLEAGANFCSACGTSLLPPALEQMIADSRRALNANPDDAAARHNLALAYKLGGLDDLALEEFQRVAALQSDFSDVHYEIALLHAKSGRRDEAVTALQRVLAIDPDHTQARRLIERLRSAP